MTRHSTSFEIESPVPPDATTALLPGATPPVGQPAAKTFNLRKALLTGAALAVLAGGVWYGWDYWTVGQYLVSTDDAYVKADNTTIAPKVSGYLHEVLVGDNERVKAGQVLARIDNRDFRVALDQAKADVAAARATIASKQAQLEVQQAVIAAAEATIDVDRATLTFAVQENKRYSDLATTGYGSVQMRSRRNRATAAHGSIGPRHRQPDVVAKAGRSAESRDRAGRSVIGARAAIQSQAELNLGYTPITAPVDGVISNRTCGRASTSMRVRSSPRWCR